MCHVCHVLVLIESLMVSTMRVCVCVYNKAKGFSPQLGASTVSQYQGGRRKKMH